MAKIKKKHVFISVVIIVIAVFFYQLSTLTKKYLINHSEALVGRRISIEDIHFNYLKLSVQVNNLVLFEENKTDTFVSFSEFFINFDPWTLITSEYTFSEIRLINPYIKIIQDGDRFNFSDLIPKEDSLEGTEPGPKKELKFTVRNIQIKNGTIEYLDVPKSNLMSLNKLGLDLPLISWNNTSSEMGVNFTMGEKGVVNIDASVDNVKNKYLIDFTSDQIDIDPVKKYVTDYFNLSDIAGLFSSKLRIEGDLIDLMDVKLSGHCAVSDLSVYDSNSEKIIASSKVTTGIKDISLKNNNFSFGKIEISNPALLLIRDTKMTNIERFILPYFRNDSVSSAAGDTIDSGAPLKYSIDTINVVDGHLSFSDRTLNRPFSYEFDQLNFLMTRFSESADQIPIEFSMVTNKKGELSGKTVWSMYQPMNFEMDLFFKRLDLLSFSPYSEFYIASPITQGWLNSEIGLKMTPTTLVNSNKVKIDELEFGKRTKDTTAMKVPIRLGLYLMKDMNDLIQFDIPVTGNPSNPEFKLGKIIWKAFGNMMLKAVSSPFHAMQGLAGKNPESLEKLPFEVAQDSMNQDQRDKLGQLASILKKKPELILIMTQTSDPVKEKDYIAIQLTKADFAKTKTSDPLAIKKIVAETVDGDPDLIDFVKNAVPEYDQIGLQQACRKRVGADRLEGRFREVLLQRNKAVSNFLIEKHGIPSESVQISIADLENLPQELRIPQFKIEVSMK